LKRRPANLLKIVVSLGLLIFLLTRIGLGGTLEALKGAHPGYLLAALVLYLVGVPLRAYRWQVLLAAVGTQVRLSRLINLYFVGTFFNTVLPSGIGGDVIRVYELATDGAGAAVATSTVLVDRATGLLVLLALAVGSTAVAHELISPGLAWAIVAIALVTFAGVGLLLWRDLWERVSHRLAGLAPGRLAFLRHTRVVAARQRFVSFYTLFRHYRGSALLGALAISLGFNVLLIVVNYLIALALGVRLSMWYFLLFVPLISFTLLLPVSFGGLGVREGAYVVLFGQAGVAAPVALAMSLAFYGLNVITGLVGGALYTWQGLSSVALTEEALAGDGE
jgi:uncharacterized protein (TIRG00374 family)